MGLYLKVKGVGYSQAPALYLAIGVSVTIWSMGQIDYLYRMQQVDDEIRQGKERLSIVLRLQKESAELLVARERAKSAKDELQRSRTSQNDLSLELSSLNNKSKRSEDRLYSGMVKNPKELADIQQEIDSLGRRREVLGAPTPATLRWLPTMGVGRSVWGIQGRCAAPDDTA